VLVSSLLSFTMARNGSRVELAGMTRLLISLMRRLRLAGDLVTVVSLVLVTHFSSKRQFARQIPAWKVFSPELPSR
jgi:hypothetical protein